MSDKTCAECRLFAPDPDDESHGACFESREHMRDISGMTVPAYYAVESGRKACRGFEPRETGR